MDNSKPIFDLNKARLTIDKGGRKKWWRRTGRSAATFGYLEINGHRVVDEPSLVRIRSLAIPPAWKDVRINPSPSGKIQALGIDALGRVQYRYHSAFAAKRQRLKFSKIERFGAALPKLRSITNEHVGLEGFPREKVLAIAMRLINSLYFRVGTELSARHYKTYGITTLHKRHLTIGRKGELKFEFVGKSHIFHRKVLVDADLAAVVKELSAIGRGRKLFHYQDEAGKIRPITPAQINAYLKQATDPEFSAKDFRTWGASVLAAAEFAAHGPEDTEAKAKKAVVRVVKRVAEELGNTPSVCRTSYIHPIVIDAYLRGITIEEFRPRRSRQINRTAPGLEPEEKALLKLFATYK